VDSLRLNKDCSRNTTTLAISSFLVTDGILENIAAPRIGRYGSRGEAAMT
jgi:hypothetical protein